MEAAGTYKDHLKEMEDENGALKGALGELQSLVDNYEKKLERAEAVVPIKVIKKRRDGKSGSPRWGVEIWELILEQLVNGTPSSLVNGNILAHVKKFSPSTKNPGATKHLDNPSGKVSVASHCPDSICVSAWVGR
jgi:hypothetical protein